MVLVFKTSIATDAILAAITPHINKLLTDNQWNVDTEDCDHVLRIVHQTDISTIVINTLTSLGISCEAL